MLFGSAFKYFDLISYLNILKTVDKTNNQKFVMNFRRANKITIISENKKIDKILPKNTDKETRRTNLTFHIGF